MQKEFVSSEAVRATNELIDFLLYRYENKVIRPFLLMRHKMIENNIILVHPTKAYFAS